MLTEENKAQFQRTYEELFNKGNLAVADELVAPDFLNFDALPGRDRGPESMRGIVMMLRGAFPDLHFTVEELVAEGDIVMGRVTASGTHQGPFQGGDYPSRQILEMRRIVLRPGAVSRPAPGEQDTQDLVNEGREVWDWLQRLLPAERRLAYLLYHCGLSAREIMHFAQRSGAISRRSLVCASPFWSGSRGKWTNSRAISSRRALTGLRRGIAPDRLHPPCRCRIGYTGASLPATT